MSPHVPIDKERPLSHLNEGERSLFRHHLLEWFDRHGRELPWRGITDPYKIWVSEIILQQTQVAQGWDYYERFISTYPTVTCLAQAKDEDVLLLWQGLGYYSRAHNMLTAARQIVDLHGGLFPATEKEVSALKGVGPYTTAAIMSIAYNAPLAVVDGNVYRILSRLEASEVPIDTTEGTKYYQQLAHHLLDKEHPGRYNQAMMDLGATICTPRNPLCHTCPIAPLCQSNGQEELHQLLPLKARKTEVQKRYLDYFLLLDDQKIWVEQRDKKGIWKGLFQFPLHIGQKRFLTTKELREHITESYGDDWQIVASTPLPLHRLTHRELHIQVHTCHVISGKHHLPAPLRPIALKDHPQYAFPKPLRAFLDSHFPTPI